MNELLIGNAVKFLSDTNVRASTSEKQLSFLRSKGLNDDEVEESYRRANMPSPLSNAQSTGSSTNYYNNYPSSSPYSGSTATYPTYNNGNEDQLYQLARTSTTARWLLLLAVFASAIAFLARHLPAGLYQRFLKWFNRTGSDERIVELNRKIDTVRALIEGLGKRQSHLESQIIALRYHQNYPMDDYSTEHRNHAPVPNGEYGDCLDEE